MYIKGTHVSTGYIIATIKPLTFYLIPICCIIICRCMQNHNDTIKTSVVSLEKYTSHFIERVVCERELETEHNCNILTPTLMAISVSFPFSWAAQPGAWGPSLSGCWFSLPHLISNSSAQLTAFLSSPGLYNNLTTTLLPASVIISHLFNLSAVKVIISWYSSTGCTCYLHRCISYFDSLPGSEVNMQHIQVRRRRHTKDEFIGDVF